MAKASLNLLHFAESESEDDLGGFAAAAKKQKQTHDMPPAKRGRPAGTTKAAKVTKPKEKETTTKRASDKKTVAAAAAAAAIEEAEADTTADSSGLLAGGRPALADRTNEMDSPVAATKAKRGRPRKAEEPEEAADEPAVKRRGRPKATKDSELHKKTAAPPTPDEADSMAVDEETSLADETASTVPQSPARYEPKKDDAALQRRLGELAKKHDALETRFQDLREVGVKEAERNFERLKKQGDERSRAADDLIASLRVELATFRDLAQQGEQTRRTLEATEKRAAELEARVADLTARLGDAKAEARTLTTKLAAARTAEAAGPAVVPGSAMKHKGPGGTAAAVAAAAAADSALVSQLKENLYGDLTGLLVWSARRDGPRELYDCIQTGRSGSLHFKLCVDNGSGTSKADEEAQFEYVPQLDASRDADLISLLPDYLTEEISFPRAQAAKFYGRVVQCLDRE